MVFLTGQNEITGVCKKLEARFGSNVVNAKKQQRAAIANKAQEIFQTDEPRVNPSQGELSHIPTRPAVDSDSYSCR